MRFGKEILENCAFLTELGCWRFCVFCRKSLTVSTSFLCTCTLLSGTCHWAKLTEWAFCVIWGLRFWTSTLGRSYECSRMRNFLMKGFSLFYRFSFSTWFQCLPAFFWFFGRRNWWVFILIKKFGWLGFYFCDKSCSKGGALWPVWYHQGILDFPDWKEGLYWGGFNNECLFWSTETLGTCCKWRRRVRFNHGFRWGMKGNLWRERFWRRLF